MVEKRAEEPNMDETGNLADDLRQAFYRLTQTHFISLQEDISGVRQDLEKLRALTGGTPEDLRTLQSTFQELAERAQRLENGIQQLEKSLEEDTLQLENKIQEVEGSFSERSSELETRIQNVGGSLTERSSALDNQIQGVEGSMEDSQASIRRLKPILHSTLSEDLQAQKEAYTASLTPIVSSALSNQIKNARADIIEMLTPIIGPTIGKAISEALSELRRMVDARLKQSANLPSAWQRLLARLKGIPSSELLLRQALPCQVQEAFLIHRNSGLLLAFVSASGHSENSDLIGAMLTAIQKFAQDAFGAQEDSLQEIQYGDSRIVLESGSQVYLAVVVQGTEPLGYLQKMRAVLQNIHQEYRPALERFASDGRMDTLPDFKPQLSTLFDLTSSAPVPKMSRGQKTFVGVGAAVLLLGLAFLIFLCSFSSRLWPLAYPAPSATPTITHTATLPPTFTATALPTSTPLPPTLTPTALPTATITLTPVVISVKAVMVGSVWARPSPGENVGHYSVPLLVNTPVDILAIYGTWAQVEWTTDYGLQTGWVPFKWVGVVEEIPASLITPTPVQ